MKENLPHDFKAMIESEFLIISIQGILPPPKEERLASECQETK